MWEGVGRHKTIKGCVTNICCTKFPSKHHHHRWHIADQSGLICIRQSEGKNPGFVRAWNVFLELFTDFHNLDCPICKYCPICNFPPVFLSRIIKNQKKGEGSFIMDPCGTSWLSSRKIASLFEWRDLHTYLYGLLVAAITYHAELDELLVHRSPACFPFSLKRLSAAFEPFRFSIGEA